MKLGPLDPTCQGVQVRAGDVPNNSLVLRCASHLHLWGEEVLVMRPRVNIALSTKGCWQCPTPVRSNPQKPSSVDFWLAWGLRRTAHHLLLGAFAPVWEADA